MKYQRDGQMGGPDRQTDRQTAFQLYRYIVDNRNANAFDVTNFTDVLLFLL